MFTNGNTAWKNRKHNGGARFTKEQNEALAGLVPDSIACWRRILAIDKTDIKWQQLKAEVASKIINKFVPELVEETKELVFSDRFIEFAADLASRISGFSKGNERRPEIAHNQTSVQAEH